MVKKETEIITRRVVNEESQTIAKVLVPQLGTNKNILGEGLIDERKVANLTPTEQDGLHELKSVGEIEHIPYLTEKVDWTLATSDAIGGKRLQRFIEITGAASGTRKPEIARKPSWGQKHLWARGKSKQLEDAASRGEVTLV